MPKSTPKAKPQPDHIEYASSLQPSMNSSEESLDIARPQPAVVSTDPIVIPCGGCRQWADDVRTLPCGHIYCSDCIRRVLDDGSEMSPSSPCDHTQAKAVPRSRAQPLSRANADSSGESDGEGQRRLQNVEFLPPVAPTPGPDGRIAKPPPDRRRLFLRLFLFLSSAGTAALAFAAGSPPTAPTDSSSNASSGTLADPTAFLFLGVLPLVSAVLALASIGAYCGRRWRNWKKFNQLYMALIDLFMTLFWAADIFVLLAKNTCPANLNATFCNFYKGATFFGMLVMFGHLIATGWDFYGIYSDGQKRRKAAAAANPAMAGVSSTRVAAPPMFQV